MNNIKKKKNKELTRLVLVVPRTKRHLFWVLFFSISLSRKREREGLGGDSGGGGGEGREDVWVERGSRWILFLFCFSELLLNDYCC